MGTEVTEPVPLRHNRDFQLLWSGQVGLSQAAPFAAHAFTYLAFLVTLPLVRGLPQVHAPAQLTGLGCSPNCTMGQRSRSGMMAPPSPKLASSSRAFQWSEPWLPSATYAARGRASATTSRTRTAAPAAAGTPTSRPCGPWRASTRKRLNVCTSCIKAGKVAR